MTTNELNNDLNTDEKNNRDYSAILFRFLYTVLFTILGWLSLWVMAAVIILQFGFWVFDGEKNQKLHDFAAQVAGYMKSILDYVSLHSDEKPFPFTKWPEQKVAHVDTKE